jgi:hypothetical protein
LGSWAKSLSDKNTRTVKVKQSFNFILKRYVGNLKIINFSLDDKM